LQLGYRFFLSILNAITVIKPETVIQWHRRGFLALDVPPAWCSPEEYSVVQMPHERLLLFAYTMRFAAAAQGFP
jgi:hypothetical protein